jgi:hypothetical protein
MDTFCKQLGFAKYIRDFPENSIARVRAAYPEEDLTSLMANKIAAKAHVEIANEFLRSLQQISKLHKEWKAASEEPGATEEKISSARRALCDKVLEEDQRLEKLLADDPFELARQARAALQGWNPTLYLSVMGLKEV